MRIELVNGPFDGAFVEDWPEDKVTMYINGPNGQCCVYGMRPGWSRALCVRRVEKMPAGLPTVSIDVSTGEKK